MLGIVASLEAIARAVKTEPNAAKVSAAIQAAKQQVNVLKSTNGASGVLEKLDGELSTWQNKLSVILAEPAGRQGMAKHALYWAEQLTKDSHGG